MNGRMINWDEAIWLIAFNESETIEEGKLYARAVIGQGIEAALNATAPSVDATQRLIHDNLEKLDAAAFKLNDKIKDGSVTVHSFNCDTEEHTPIDSGLMSEIIHNELLIPEILAGKNARFAWDDIVKIQQKRRGRKKGDGQYDDTALVAKAVKLMETGAAKSRNAAAGKVAGTAKIPQDGISREAIQKRIDKKMKAFGH